MSIYEYALESDELYESDESDEFSESDELSERRRPRKPSRIAPGKTGSGTGLFKPRPVNGNKYATQAQLEAGLARVGNQISANSDAIKKVAAQSNRINSELGAATARLDKQVNEIRKEVKKQAETSMLLMLLQKPPVVDAPTKDVLVPDPAFPNDPTKFKTGKAVDTVTLKPQDNLLPLMLMMSSGSGGLGGDNNMMLFAMLAKGMI